jgi:type II restriction/modification system DNA methylase subunit YeeA
MPVNTAALKTFAPAMRRQLLEAVGRKLDLLLNSQTPDTLATYAKQIAELREQEAENRDQLLERVAYTWFNRLCALRYLDARGWHPFGCKVLMPAAEGETQPELLKLMRAGSLPTELKLHTNEVRLHGLLDGQIPAAIAGGDPQGEVYRELVLASCRSYHQLLPELFEGLDDASELLLPDDLLSEGSIAGGFRSAISDEDCDDVEIIGWLYQFYISEKKDQVIGKVVKCEDIPAATQLFTPNWIVKYMVQNSLGATWLATYPDSPLKDTMEFYIEPAEQTPEVQTELAAISPKNLEPEALTLIDPACGSGHILVEAYELLKSIYLERGYRQRDIPELILTKNLHGLDICPRAAQLAIFSLLMKGREDDRRLLERGVSLNIMALQDSTGLNLEHLAMSANQAPACPSKEDLQMLVEAFAHATAFGSLIKVADLLGEKVPAIIGLSNSIGQGLLESDRVLKLNKLARQAAILSKRYDVVVANPPYMGGKYHAPILKSLIGSTYPDAKSDLFSAFILRCVEMSKKAGHIGIMCPNVWMYISSHEKLRGFISKRTVLKSLVELPLSGFKGATVQICSFVLRNYTIKGSAGSGIRLVDFSGSDSDLSGHLKEAIRDNNCGWRYITFQDEFEKIPGGPIAYWITGDEQDLYVNGCTLDSVCQPRKGIDTGENSVFLRFWWEVPLSHCMFGGQSAVEKWFPYNKGGDFRRWYGNRDYVVNWQSDGSAIKSRLSWTKKKPTIRNAKHFLREGFTWTTVSSGGFSARYSPPGALFDNGGCTLFAETNVLLLELGAFLNSVVAQRYLSFLSPTLNFQPGDIGRMLYRKPVGTGDIAALISQSSQDWMSRETSWEFQHFSLLDTSSSQRKPSLALLYEAITIQGKLSTSTMKLLEEENNRFFIDAYDLQGELSPEVPIEQITLLANPAYRYGGNLSEEERWERFRRDMIAELISYSTGCMMGRYSLDRPGLILADCRDSQPAHLAAYEEKVGKQLFEVQFKPDPDGIIPVLDGEWFEDDIVARTREFLAVTFPESTLTENLRFIEESLGKDIRKYFCTEFYKDHLQTYKKRPIYWMVQSPKKGFACLIYLHRYTKDTLNQVLNNYFRPYLQKLEARLGQLEQDQINDSLPTRERTAARKEAEKITKVLKECQAWEQDALLPLAQQRIELDLDDGVKVNYLKLQDVLATIPGLAAKED